MMTPNNTQVLKNQFAPLAKRVKSVLHIRQFLKNPIPFMMENLKECGSTYRFNLRQGRTNIVTTDPDIIQHIFRKNADNYCKPIGGNEVLIRYIGKGLLLNEGKSHTRQCKEISKGMHLKKLEYLTKDIHLAAELFFDKIVKQNSDRINVFETMHSLVFSVLCKSIYGPDLDDQQIVSFKNKLAKLHSYLPRLIRFPSLNKIYSVTGYSKKISQVKVAVDEIILSIVNFRKKHQPQRHDLLSMLMEIRYTDDDTAMTDQQLIAETLCFFIAGHETATNVLSWLVYALSENPEIENKLSNEINERLNNKPADFFILQQLPYLSNVINETLRMYPPSWITDRIAKEDDTVNGFLIPKGSKVIPFTYGLHHTESIWKNPDRFNPDRFEVEQKKARHNFSFVPFGAGPRMCIGRNLAMLSIKLIMIALLKNNNFQFIPSQKVGLSPKVTLLPDGPIWLGI